MSLTLLQLQDEVSLVWSERHDPRLNKNRCINEAGRYLFGMHSWHWRSRPPADLAFVADQAYVAMPSDFGFGEIVSLTMTDSVTYGIELTTPQVVEEMRADNVLSPTMYWAALVYPTQASTSAAPGSARLEVYPTPSSSDADAIQLVYRSGWVELSSSSAVANVPSAFDFLLVDLVRAFAQYYLTRDRSAIEAIEDSAMLRRLKRMDGAAQTDLGKTEGGILQHVYYHPLRDGSGTTIQSS